LHTICALGILHLPRAGPPRLRPGRRRFATVLPHEGNSSMRSVSLLLFPLVLLSPAPAAASEAGTVAGALHQDLRVRLEPDEHALSVVNRLTLPEEMLAAGDAELRFVLHAGLEIRSASGAFSVERLPGEPDRVRYGINEDEPGRASVPLREYVLRPAPRAQQLGSQPELVYEGTIHHPLVTEGEEYARSFSRTPGIVGSEGIVLSGSSYWLPDFGERLVTFRLSVDLPQGWDAVSQGRRTAHSSEDGRRLVTWDSPEPMDEVYLIAARFHEYSRKAGEVTAYAFLREPDPALAGKYLEATAQYVEMYEDLIGPYPYAKFALVENFWETGYGMPSFTLLGPRIIRFPFILQSSYPHEILHNWWGNSVFVDYPGGNWCEGLTAYLADHLLKEGQGQGAAYRRDTLNKYRSYVRGGRDFPLTEFRSRHSSATEAVGYGKSLMLWHMLRRRLGDDMFADGLRRFYESARFTRAGFADLERAFAAASGEDLSRFFAQWVERTGAPRVELGEVSAAPDGDGFRLSVEVRQSAEGEPYSLSLPVAVTVEGEREVRTFALKLERESALLEVRLDAEPLLVEVDPQFDLFRRLDPREIPPSLAQLFGAERVTIVLPGDEPAFEPETWRSLADAWAASGAGALDIVMDDEIESLPADRAVWLLGSVNAHSEILSGPLTEYGAGIDGETLRFGASSVPRAGASFVYVVRHPSDPDLAIGWIGTERADALAGLARKLPHYGKYSYLAFNGGEPENVAKGQWPALGSPMVRSLAGHAVESAALPAREPLVRPRPAFDSARMLERVRTLASDEMEGRGVGTAGIEAAATLIAKVFESAGLEPGGDDGSWFQSWAEPGGPAGEPVALRNVIGVIPGTNPQWAEQSVVIGAHYDHLGRGWPEARTGAAGQIHPGADDNASGVAVLLELAELLGRDAAPARTIVFAAFTAEEWALRGSRHYVESIQRWPVSDAIAMINLDTVGRLGGGTLSVLGTGSASEWVHIVRGVGFTTGVAAQSIADDPGGSDQKSFVAAGVPAVQLFTGGHQDYHRPSDTADRVDAEGLVKVATFAREALGYLSEREHPLTPEGVEPPADGAGSTAGGRSVSLGTLPEFAFEGPGVKVEKIMPGTPAEAAGLRPGDLIVAIDDEPVESVRAYSDLLKSRQPGDTITIRLVRDGAELTLEATLVAR
jgi:hypothetical protein